MAATFLTIWFLQMAAMVIPGPNFLFISHLAAANGRREATIAAVGIAIGASVWASAAVLGVGALFGAAPTLRIFLQIVGAGYLLAMAIRFWRAHPKSLSANAVAVPASGALRARVLTNLSNPKSALFFGSVFSTALPQDPSVLAMWAAVLMIAINSFGWHALLAYLFSSHAVRSQYARQQILLARAGGSVLGIFGLALLWASLREARSRL